MIVTSFSDFRQPIDEAPRHLKGRKLHQWLLRNLRNRNRVSVFELSESQRVANAMMFLNRIGKIKLDNKAYEYPYVGIEIRK